LLQRLEQIRGNVEIADAAAVGNLLEVDDAFGELRVALVDLLLFVDVALEVRAARVILRIGADVEPPRAFRIHLRLRTLRPFRGRPRPGRGGGARGSTPPATDP